MVVLKLIKNMNSSYRVGIFLLIGLLLSGVVAVVVGLNSSIGLGLGLLAALDIVLIVSAYYLIKQKND